MQIHDQIHDSRYAIEIHAQYTRNTQADTRANMRYHIHDQYTSHTRTKYAPEHSVGIFTDTLSIRHKKYTKQHFLYEPGIVNVSSFVFRRYCKIHLRAARMGCIFMYLHRMCSVSPRLPSTPEACTSRVSDGPRYPQLG